MRIFASIAAVLLFLFLLISVPGFSQQGGPDHPPDEKSKDQDKDAKGHGNPGRQDENRRDESRPTGRQQDSREHPQAAPAEDRRDEHASRTQEQTRPEGQPRPEERRDDRRVEGNAAHPVQGQRGQRIPEQKFRASFGPEHHFHVKRARISTQAQPAFIYSGYTFELTDPWPTEWSYDDDCYIDYVDDNYYLFDVYHPGVRILVFVIG